MSQGNFSEIMRQITEAQNKANQANLQRYQQLLGHIDTLGQQVGAQGTFGQAEQLMSQIGGAARTEIQDQALKTAAQAEQDLITRGLGNTTMRTAAQRGVSADTQKALAAQSEREAAARAGLLTQRAQAEMGIGQMKAGAIEGRQDTGPDLNMFASLLQAAAAADKAAGSGKATVSSGWSPALRAAMQGGGSGGGGGGGSGGGSDWGSSGGGGTPAQPASAGYSGAAPTGGGFTPGPTGTGQFQTMSDLAAISGSPLNLGTGGGAAQGGGMARMADGSSVTMGAEGAPAVTPAPDAVAAPETPADTGSGGGMTRDQMIAFLRGRMVGGDKSALDRQSDAALRSQVEFFQRGR